MIERTKGKCIYCSEEFAKGGMAKHLKNCKLRDSFLKKDVENGSVFLIQISGSKDYWLFVEANESSNLSNLDDFLRDIWLECCGHLSCFTINGTQFYSDKASVREFGGALMSVPLKHILNTETVFEHEYDFGTTTCLLLKVIEKKKGNIKNNIKLISRNSPPIYECNSCKTKATDICDNCLWEDEEHFFCEKCLKNHKCKDDMALPIVNSPRVGQCGYTGNDGDDV